MEHLSANEAPQKGARKAWKRGDNVVEGAYLTRVNDEEGFTNLTLTNDVLVTRVVNLKPHAGPL